jgi:hypothetical protein
MVDADIRFVPPNEHWPTPVPTASHSPPCHPTSRLFALQIPQQLAG